jgi:hypothetical protein
MDIEVKEKSKRIDSTNRMEAQIRIKKLTDRNGIKKLINSNLTLYPNEIVFLTNLLRFNTNPISALQLSWVSGIKKRHRTLKKLQIEYT